LGQGRSAKSPERGECMIKESYIANWRNLPEDWIKIRVARPSILAPSLGLLRDYKEGRIDWKGYCERFRNEIFSNDNALNRLKEIGELSKDKIVCLICYEKTYPCHRFLLIDYIKELKKKEATHP
jgi:uncharacterized protein YeaO (DUF488 family)